MKRIGLAVLVLVLGLVACSSPDDLTAGPQLGAQFGSPDDEIPVDVAFSSTGRIYSISNQFGPTYSDEGYENGEYSNAVLRRFDNNGKLIWTRPVVETGNGEWTIEYGSYGVKSLKTNSQGYIYVLSGFGITEGDCLPTYHTWVTKIDALGNEVRSYTIGYTGNTESFSGDLSSSAAIAVDGNGNLYAAAENGYVDSGECITTGKTLAISKINPQGVLQWRRTSTVGESTDIFIAASGNLYVAGTKGLAKYTNSGSLVWTKAIGPLENVVVAGPNIYTRYRKEIRKFDGNGKQLWLKPQTGFTTFVPQKIAGDNSGNLYLSGKYNAGSGNWNPFARKINSSGTVLWTKTFGTPAYDDARGIATITGSEIYVTGETQGSLSHTNIGGRDGYLRKLNSSGNLVWSK